MLSHRLHPTLKFSMKRNYSSQKSPQSGHLVNLSHYETNGYEQYDDYLEMHRRNIIIDYKKKVQQITTMRQRMSASIPKRKLNYLKYKNLKIQPKTSQVQSQSFLQPSKFTLSHKDKVIAINTIIFCPEDLKYYQIQALKTKPLTPFQKSSINKMKTKKQLILKKKSGKILTEAQQQIQKSFRLRKSMIKSHRISTQ